MASTHETALEAMAAGREAGVADRSQAHESRPGRARGLSYAVLFPEWREANPIRQRWSDRAPKPMRDTSGMTYNEFRAYLYDRWGMDAPPVKTKRAPRKLVVELQARIAELERIIAKHGITTQPRRCEWDRKPLPEGARAGTRYCSDRCRQAAHRAGRS